MASPHWSVGEFNPAMDDWVAYIERVDFYFVANNITDATVQRALLLSSCGAQTYKLIRNLVAPAKPMEKTYKDIVGLVKVHLKPKASVAVERLKFHSRVRKPNESVASFVCALRELSQSCEFANLEEMLKDRLICGIGDARMQRRLLSEAELTFQKALDLLSALEAADSSASEVESTLQPTSKPQVFSLLKQPKHQGKPPTHPCYRCGGAHTHQSCKFRTATCHYCHKQGHIARVCRSKQRNSHKKTSTRATNFVEDSMKETDTPREDDHNVSSSEVEGTYSLFNMNSGGANKPWVVEMYLDNHHVKMQIDTGATFSVMSRTTYESMWSTPPRKSEVSLKTYSGEQLTVLGERLVHVKYLDQSRHLPLLIVESGGPTLLGRDWLQELKLNWEEINSISTAANHLSLVLQKHSRIFAPELGKFTGPPIDSQLAKDAVPRFHKARSVPFVLRERIEEELNRLLLSGVIVPVKSSEWATPIVPVVKQDGKVRICGDYKLTANPASDVLTYPLPKIEELFSQLSGGKRFSKLDLSHAYLQLPLQESSMAITTISTHKGLFKYTRLPFGISSAPAIFQRTMDTLFQGMRHVTAYIDDIVVTGRTEEEHLRNLDEVLTKLENHGLRLKEEKCRFWCKEVEYLGHLIDSEGLRPTPAKIQAIKEAPTPRNVSTLRSFLGLVNYYSKFLPNLSSKLSPLYVLLQDSHKWTWGKQEEDCFALAKQLLSSSRLLIHFNPLKDLYLSCDASQYGVGAVLSHRNEDGSEQPISFVSRTLTGSEKKYSQLDKEALAIVFGVSKFHQYLYGRPFTIITDHKPLIHLFHPKKSLPQMASARLQRWALTLGMHNYSIEFRPGKENANADALSRLPLEGSLPNTPIPGDILMAWAELDNHLVSAADVKKWTASDPILSQILRFVTHGWPRRVVEEGVSPFFKRRNELSVQDGCIMWGSRVVIPPPGRDKLLQQLHEAHQGISRMKMLARSFIWWPGLDSDVESTAKKCQVCQVHQSNPPLAPVYPLQWPNAPWSRLHVDFAGPIMGKMVLVVVDAYSKWIEAHVMPSCTSRATVDRLRSIFSSFGLPKVLISDNGPSFTSAEFKTFVKQNGMVHHTTAPYHPASNGQAERAVQVIKAGLRKLGGPLEMRLLRLLFSYRTTPQTTTGVSPAELLFGRPLRTRLDWVIPDIAGRVQKRQMLSSSSRPTRSFDVSDSVLCRNFSSVGDKWIPAVIKKKTGPLSYEVLLPEGRVVRRHINQLRIRAPSVHSDVFDRNPSITPAAESEPEPVQVRRSTRPRRAPDRFDPSQ